MFIVDQATQCTHFTLQCLHVLSFKAFSNIYIYIYIIYIYIIYILMSLFNVCFNVFTFLGEDK